MPKHVIRWILDDDSYVAEEFEGNIFFTSDNHFGHKNIHKFCPATRPHQDVGEMDEMMIAQWNSQVGPEDIVFPHGDFSWHDEEKTAAILRRLMGRKHAIWGNHDYVIRKSKLLQSMFCDIRDLRRIVIDGYRVFMTHYPMYSWEGMHHGTFHTYGHVHSDYGFKEHPVVTGRAIDVGVDSRGGYRLWTWDEIRAILSKRLPPQHHVNGR